MMACASMGLVFVVVALVVVFLGFLIVKKLFNQKG